MAATDPARRGGPVAATPAARRAPWGTISREQVIDVAEKIVTQRGFEHATIRNLAAELGVAPMSLYRHVRDKNDLLDAVVDRLLAQVWRPRGSVENWRAWITEAADNLRRFLIEQPAALHIYLSHPVVSPTALVRMNAVMRTLRQVLDDERQARQAYAAIHTYTIGFAALEASRAAWRPTNQPVDDLSHQLAAYTTPQQFIEGLNYLLDGISSSI
jgi:AcrR family transcriptional regulator